MPKFDQYGQIINEDNEDLRQSPNSASGSIHHGARSIPNTPTRIPDVPVSGKVAQRRRLTPAFLLISASMLLLIAGVIFSQATNSRIEPTDLTSPIGSSTDPALPTDLQNSVIPDASELEQGDSTPSILQTTTPIPSGPSRVQIQDVNFRSEPNPNSQIISVLRRGVKVLVLDEARPYEQAVWVKVQVDDQIGWINQRFLKPVGVDDEQLPRARVVGTAPDSLLIRPQPSRSGDPVDRVSEGAELILLPEQEESAGILWQHVRIDESDGWVNSAYLQVLP